MNSLKHIKVSKKEYLSWIDYCKSCNRILHENNMLGDIVEIIDNFSELVAWYESYLSKKINYYICIRLPDNINLKVNKD